MVDSWQKDGNILYLEEAMNVFDVIPNKDYLSFYEKTIPQYNRIAGFLDFKKEDVSRATGFSINSIRWEADRMPTELKKRIEEWATLYNLVAGHFDADRQKTYLWFVTLNPLLGNVTPRDMIRFGRYKKLYLFVLTALAENKR